ncbi:IucA/IucC family protein [Mechercharimyces sp. CAU 1602]|uniref:IucA/IucC family protein n=1 Tax=Mechercharimyces sp. CAU 1602 TaxID=2973933 RepID=UPI0037C96FDE
MKAMEHIRANLNPKTWEVVSHQLLTKMIAELMYEDMLQPVAIDEVEGVILYRLELKSGITYTFKGKKRIFDSFRIVKDSILRYEGGESAPATNPIRFLLDIQSTVGMAPLTTGHLIREYNQTLIADAHIYEQKQQSRVDPSTLDYAELEGVMEGHPWITYNKGRIGFSYQDYLAYAPEQQQEVSLDWIAVQRGMATFHAVSDLDYGQLIRSELGEEQVQRFTKKLELEGAKADQYYFLPVHEWQWDQYIIPFFPEDIANKRIIPLGRGEDQYLPQQSIRTFVNRTHSERHHVKLPMSILNTLVYRGLPGERTVVAPKITEYIKGIWQQDAFLRDECRTILPGEVASINYDHPYYSQLEGAPYQYLEMLGCIWRESIYSYLEDGEQPITLASLLYVDGEGVPFVSRLIHKSGLTVEKWVERLVQVILPPLLHYLYKYGVVFSPHGQNTILVLKDGVPHRLAVKDFVDDVNVSDEPLPELENLSQELKNVLRSEPAEGLCQFIFTGLFICHFRYLSDILEEHHQWAEENFWAQVRTGILAYQARFPELKERYELFDLLRPSFTKLCLNRNRMLDYGYADDDDRPHASEHGRVTNALSNARAYSN